MLISGIAVVPLLVWGESGGQVVAPPAKPSSASILAETARTSEDPPARGERRNGFLSAEASSSRPADLTTQKPNGPLPAEHEVLPPTDHAQKPSVDSPPRVNRPSDRGLLSRVKEKITPKRVHGEEAKGGVRPSAEPRPPSNEGREPVAPVARVLTTATGEPLDAPAKGPTVRTGDFPVLQQTVAKYRVTPVAATNPAEVSGNLQEYCGRIRDSVRLGDYEAVQREADAIRVQACSLRTLSSLSLEQRLKVSSICRMVDDGLQMIEEGRLDGDSSKIHLGLEKIHEASELLTSSDWR